jgi:low affinity Fe/Cu permease
VEADLAAHPDIRHPREGLGGFAGPMNMSLQSRLRQTLPYALVLLLSCWFLAAYFDIAGTLHEANAHKTILIENISGPGNSAVHLGYVKQNYQTLLLTDFAAEDWVLGPIPGSDLVVLTSARVGDQLQVQIPIAGSTQFIFITASDAGRVRVTDLETGRASELDLQAAGYYTVTHSTVSGTKHAWDLFLLSLVVLIGGVTLTAAALKGWRDGLRIWNEAAHFSLAYAVIGLTLLLNNLFMAQRLFFLGDSQSYWDVAPTFLKDGVFAFGNLEALYSFRGYVIPLLAFVSQRLAALLGREPTLVYVLILAVIYTAFFVFIVPRIIRWLTGREARPYQLLIVFALTGFFWLGWFTWLLSDLLSLAVFLTGMSFLLQATERRDWLNSLLGGVFMGLAINCRVNYELGAAVAFGLVFYLLFRKQAVPQANPWRKFFLIAALCGAGVILVSLPQVQLNWQKYHKASLFPFSAENWFESNLETNDTVLEYGLAIGRLKTEIWPSPYPNRIGISTLYRYFGLDPLALHDFQAAGDMLHRHGGMNVALYFDLARKYPLEFTVDSFLKVFTGLNNQSFEPYPVNWHAGLPVALFSFFNYGVLFLAAFITWQHLSQLVNHRQGAWRLPLWYLSLALPVLPFVVMAVEWRYFLPIYFSLYLLLVTTERAVYAKIFSNKLWPLSFMLFVLVCYALTTLVTPTYLE